ncbi:MAG: hypothetical protein JNM55_15880 [Anaerolineales bacterium]|nr:hypothetical protein [Anaerolineales bacterium]
MKHKNMISISLIAVTLSMLACSSVSSLIATPTPLPTFTPIPTNTPVPSASVFEETEFTRASCFGGDSSDEDVERFSEGGQFHMTVKTPNLLAWTICDADPIQGDYILEADVTTVDGPDNNAAGLIFNYNDNTKEFYNFAIGADGYYVMTKDGLNYTEPTFLVEWNTSSAIQTGKSTNHIKLEVIGSTFKYYVNDTLVGEVSDSSLTNGQVGFLVGTFDDANVHISFDNVKISKP